MADASGDSENNGAAALTTPVRRTDAIASVVAAAAHIEIQLSLPTRSPFVRHPVPTAVTIAARCSLDGGGAPVERRAQFRNDGAAARLEIPLSRGQAAELVAVEVWAEPYGHAALLDANGGRLALGRLRFERPLRGPSNRAVLQVHVLAGVVSFIVAEMSRNLDDPAVAFCRRANEQARRLSEGAERMQREAANANIFLRGGMYEAAGQQRQAAGVQKALANARFAYRVHTNSGAMSYIPGGDWDHKPIIAPVWGERNRLGDSTKVYYYDIWSNIHFGFIGHAAGFTLEELLGGSDVQQRADHGADDESADKSSVRAGYNLYSDRPGSTISVARVLAVVAAHDDWTIDARQREWDAARGS